MGSDCEKQCNQVTVATVFLSIRHRSHEHSGRQVVMFDSMTKNVICIGCDERVHD